MKTVLAMHHECLRRVQEEKYFLPIFDLLVRDLVSCSKLQPEQLETVDNIAEFWNEFWIRLPDSPSIQCGPFWLICDICEFVYGGDE